jgi:hypothetical protein
VGWLPELLKYLTVSNEMASAFWGSSLPLGFFHYENPVTLEGSWNMADASLVPQLQADATARSGAIGPRFREFLQ